MKRPRSRHGHKYSKYIKCLSIKQHVLHVLSNTVVTFEAQFMRKLTNIEAEMKKALLIKKSLYIIFTDMIFWCYKWGVLFLETSQLFEEGCISMEQTHFKFLKFSNICESIGICGV